MRDKITSKRLTDHVYRKLNENRGLPLVVVYERLAKRRAFYVRLSYLLNEAAIAEKHPSAASFNNIIHPHPERDLFVLYHEDES